MDAASEGMRDREIKYMHSCNYGRKLIFWSDFDSTSASEVNFERDTHRERGGM